MVLVDMIHHSTYYLDLKVCLPVQLSFFDKSIISIIGVLINIPIKLGNVILNTSSMWCGLHRLWFFKWCNVVWIYNWYLSFNCFFLKSLFLFTFLLQSFVFVNSCLYFVNYPFGKLVKCLI